MVADAANLLMVAFHRVTYVHDGILCTAIRRGCLDARQYHIGLAFKGSEHHGQAGVVQAVLACTLIVHSYNNLKSSAH